MARGGGSIEDLWGFNEEIVVRAVVASTIPIISAVGHETDTTLIDYASDMRAPTPTAAAEAAVPVRAELIGYVDDLGHRQRHGARRIALSYRDRLRAATAGLPRPADLVAGARQRLDHAAANLVAGLRHLGQRKTIDLGRTAPRLTPNLLRQRTRDLASRLADLRHRSDAAIGRSTERKRAALETAAAKLSPITLRADLRQIQQQFLPLAQRLGPAFVRLLRQRGERLDSLSKLMESFSYRNVLARGFALVTDSDGEIVRSKERRLGEPLSIEVADGPFSVVVGGSARPRRKPRPPSDDGGQESLF